MSQPHGAAKMTQYVSPRKEEPKQARRTKESSEEPSTTPSDEIVPAIKTPPSVPVPTMGWQATWFKVVSSFDQKAEPKWISKKELNFLAEQARIEEQERLDEIARQEQLRLEREAEEKRIQLAIQSKARLREQSDQCPHLVVTYIGVKGSAATTTTMVNEASIVADDTRTLVYGADFNPASGTAGARLGKEFGETVSIQEFASIVDEVKGDRKSVNARLRPTIYGVRVLSADDYTEIPGEQYGTTTERMLDVLEENCDYLHVDTPNDITTPAARAVLKKSDVFVFTANVGEPDSLRLLRVSMDTVRKLGHSEKVTRSVVVISNVPAGKTVEDYTKYLSQTNLNHEVTGWMTPGEFEGQILTIPHDKAIAQSGEVNLEEYHPSTIQAYRDLGIAIFDQALDIKSGSDLSALERS